MRRVGHLAAFVAITSMLGGCQCGGRTSFARGELRLSPASLTFNSATRTAQVQALEVSNVGRAEVPITAVTITGDTRGAFRVATLDSPIPAGSVVMLAVTYEPSAEGSDAAQLVIDAEASNGSTFAVALLGTAHAVIVDSGTPDAGFDAGTPDAGFDAGMEDAGFDAGVDAGFDAGQPDAGFDAGPPVYTVTGVAGGLGNRTSTGSNFSVEGRLTLPAPRTTSSGGTFTLEPTIPGGN